MENDTCIICGEESTVGCSGGDYHYFVCDKHWQDIKRGKIKLNLEDLRNE